MNYYLTLAILLFVYMTAWFIVSLIRQRNDVADIAWGLGFVMLAWVGGYLSGGMTQRGFIASLLVSVWGVRLAWHIYKRNRNKPEDYRYQQWRKDWGKWFYVRSYLQVYLLQGALLFLIVSSILVIHQHAESGRTFLDIIGVTVWLIGFYFEAVGDAQLAKFLAGPENKGKLMQTGLWAYTRHPNYFGEVTQWWGIWLIALSVPMGWAAIVSPLTITILILKVSGVPMLEKKMQQHPDFAAYKKRTNAFLPWKPRNL